MQYLGTDDQGTNSFSLQDFEPSFGSKLNASVREAWLEGLSSPAYRSINNALDTAPKITASEAEAYRMNEGGGVKMHLSPKDGQYSKGQWSTIVDRQRELAAIKDVRERTPFDMGSIIRGGAMFGAGMSDPLNLATAIVPWTRMVGVARGLQAATAAGSWTTRAGARAALGGIDGAVSTTALEPFNAYWRRDLGDDYGALDSMANIAFGTAFGGGLHVIGGGAADFYKYVRGRADPVITPNPSMDTAAPLAGAAAGLDTRVKVGDAYEPARWSVVEADTLQATVDKADNQFRDRSRPAYQAEIQSRANALDPAMVLGDSPVMDIGAPTLAADGRIVGGNGRTLFINKAYEIGKGGDYRAALEARLTDLGIDVDAVRGMSKPVLVRQFTREVDVKRAAMLSNEGGATDMSPLEQAKVDAERLGDARLSVSADGDINNADNRVAIRKWVEAQPDNKRNSIMDSDGKLSPEGLRRLNGAMLFKAYGDTPVLARLIEAVDPGSRNLALALGRTAPVVANSRAAIAAGDLHPLDIAADLQQAVEKYNQIRGQGGKVADYLAQLDAFGDGLTPEATMLLDFMGRNIQSPRRIMDAITGFADRLDEAGNPKQSDMFGAASAPDKTRLLEDAIAAAEARPDSAAEVVAGLAPETREAALRASVAQSVDGRNVDVDAVIGLDPDRATHTIEDAKAAADRNFEPEQASVADADAAADVQARVDAAPKWQALKDAEDALADADVLLSDTVAAGDQAFKYSRGEAPGQKKATIWQGTTARFGAEEGKPHGGFRWDMINSSAGEGAQVFGYGHYVAQQAWISQTRYRDLLIGRKKRGVVDEFYIADGVGGVVKVSNFGNEKAWQLADGTIIHQKQKDRTLAATALAIDSMNRLGSYDKAKNSFGDSLGGAVPVLKKMLASLKKQGDSTSQAYKDVMEGMNNASLVHLAADALDDVTTITEFSEQGTNEKGQPLFNGTNGSQIVKLSDAKFIAYKKANKDISYAGLFSTLENAKDAISERSLAHGIKKYEPPVPDNFRTRVVAEDGEEITGDLGEFILAQAGKKRGVLQTLGRDLKQGPTQIEGANVKVVPVDLINGTKFDAELQALHDRGVTELTVERPGSLYRAEMSAEDFAGLMLWNESLPAQPAKVQAAFAAWGIEPYKPEWKDSADGMTLDHDGITAVIKEIKTPDIGVVLDDIGWKIEKARDGAGYGAQVTFRDGSTIGYDTIEIANAEAMREWRINNNLEDGGFRIYIDGRDKGSYADVEGAQHFAEEYMDAKEKTAKHAYDELQVAIESDMDDLLDDDLFNAIREIAARHGMDPIDVHGATFKPDEIASVMLHNAGVPGHAFLDGDSRGPTDTPAYNLVLYSDDVAKIMDRYARQTGEVLRGTDDPAGLTEALRQSFGRSTDALIEAGNVKIVATPDDIPGGPHPGDVKAATAADGTVYVVASNVSELEARGIMVHEVGVHVGMEKMLGADVFQSVLRELDDAIGRGEDWAQAARSHVPEDTPAGLVREEQLAYLVQHAPELPIVQRIIAAVRAWAYRTFEFARETVKGADGKERTRVQLTEADFRAMAVAALHDAARRQDVPEAGFGNMAPAYSRGETPDPSTTKDELKPYDDAVKRAKGYASVLRSAADKLENDAQATAAMRAAMPDISPQEINDLLFQLRKQVKGLRGMTRSARDALGADEIATGMQYDAMQAADTLANNIQMAAVIEKRNAKLNIAVRLKATAYVNQFRDAGLDFEGFRGLLVGTERKRAGGRVSVESEQKNFRGEWLGGMIADLEKQGLMRAFASGEFDRDAYAALYNLAKDGAGNEKLPKEAVAIAEIVNKYQSDARNTRNRFGAWIRDLQGYIVRQSHDMFKIRNAGEKAYKEAVLPLLDLKRSMRDFDGSADDFLTRVYDDFAAGSHMKTAAGEDDLQAFGAGSSLARKESQSRVLYFKDGDSAYQYNQKFGQGKLSDSVLGGLDHAAKSAGLLKLLGTNPQATAERLFKEYAESLRGDPKRRSAFLSHRNELDNLLAHVDGSANIPGNATAAKISSFTRAWESMAKLGGMLITSVTDLPNYAAELRFGQNKNLLSGVLDGIGALTRGRTAGEKRAVLNSLGVFHESTLGSVFARFDSPDLMGGKTAAAMQMFFKLTGMNWWTESLRDGYALSHSAYVSSHSGKSFDKLPTALRDMLGLYNVDAGKWDVLRLAKTQMADGRGYITPDGLRTVPRAALENYIIQAGRKVTDAAIMNLQDDLSSALRTMTIDRMHHAVIEPGARARAFMLRGTQPGTVPGELLRFVSQFKSFPVALIQSTLGREVYGRGYDTLGDYVKRGKGDMLGLASFIALSTAMGYAAMSIKDLLRGKNPRPVDDPRTWAAAMVQGGGLGIYGDFLFGKFNRMGGSLSGSMAGPVANLADTAADLWTRIRTGDDVAATAFNAALQNTPFANLFYTRVALDYLVLHRIQEAMNPGFLKRMERRVERDNGQTFFLPPSQVAR